MMQQHTDRILAEPDMGKMAILYQEYAPAIFAYLVKHTPREENAEDLLAEVFMAALENAQFPGLSEKVQLAWLWRVARNKTVDAYRRSIRHRNHHIELESITESISENDDLGPERFVMRQEEFDVLQRHLKSLPPQQQEILRLRFGEDMRCSEIANQLGKREGAIKVMLSRTLNLLKSIYHPGKEE